VVEGVEKLTQLEHMLGQVRRFGGGNALVDHRGSFDDASHSSQISLAASPARELDKSAAEI